MFTCASTVYTVSCQLNLIGLDFIPNNLPLKVTKQCSPAFQLCTCTSCNLSTELNVPPLVATSLLNHFEDFVKTPLSFNTSVTDPFSVPTDSHLYELPNPETTWEQTLSIFNKNFSGEVLTAGLLVLPTHYRLGTLAEAQPVLPLPQVPLTGLPEPFHACSSWIWPVALGFSLVKTTLFCPQDSPKPHASPS